MENQVGSIEWYVFTEGGNSAGSLSGRQQQWEAGGWRQWEAGGWRQWEAGGWVAAAVGGGWAGHAFHMHCSIHCTSQHLRLIIIRACHVHVRHAAQRI